MKCNLVFAWYDMWVGVFWDGKKGKLYVLPFPCVGLCFTFKKKLIKAVSENKIENNHV